MEKKPQNPKTPKPHQEEIEDVNFLELVTDFVLAACWGWSLFFNFARVRARVLLELRSVEIG